MVEQKRRLISTGGANWKFVAENGVMGQHGVEMRMEEHLNWSVNRECSVVEDDF